MSFSENIDEEDRQLFRRSVGEVAPVKQKGQCTCAQKTSQRPTHSNDWLMNNRFLVELADGSNDPEILETGEELYFKRSGLQQRQFRKLQRGQLKIEHEVDLHGMTIASAKTALAQFLGQAGKSNWRCIRIIHGKGNNSRNGVPVIKGKLNQWLQQRDEVLAFCSAQPRHGGTGAVYVLLKKEYNSKLSPGHRNAGLEIVVIGDIDYRRERQ